MANQLLESAAEAQTLTNAPSRRAFSQTKEANLNQVRRAYQADQQVKYLHLQAEIDVLFRQLQSLQQRQRTS